MLVKNLVVTQVVRERRRSAARLRSHEHRGAGHSNRGRRRDGSHELFERNSARLQPFRDDAAAGLPRGHQREDDCTHDEWQPAAVQHLQQVRAEERKIDRKK